MLKNPLADFNSQKPRPVINEAECKGCERCVIACPARCLVIAEMLSRRGVKPVKYTGAGCNGCGICFYNCPEPRAIVIEIPKKDITPTV